MGFFSKVWDYIEKPLGYAATAIGGLTSALVPGVGTAIGGPTAALGLKMIDSAEKNEAREDAKKQFSSEQQFNAEQAQLNRDFQREERLQTQLFNVDMWNMSNEYNSPVAQLRRADQAGINPNALFSNGVDGAGSARPVTSSPMSGATASSSSSLANSLLLYDAQLENIRAQTKLINSQTDESQYNVHWNKISEQQRLDSLQNMNDESRGRLAKIFSDIGMNDVNKELQTQMFEWYKAKTSEEIRLMQEQCTTIHNTGLRIAQETKNLEKQGAIIDLQKTNQEYQNSILKVRADFSEATQIPEGTPLYEALYALNKRGRFNDATNLLKEVVEADNATNHPSVQQLPGKLANRINTWRSTLPYDFTDVARLLMFNPIFYRR